MVDLLRSLRFRLTALATVLTAVLLTIAAVAVVAGQQNALETRLDADLTARAADIELALAGGLISEEVADPRSDERIVQIVDVLDRVVAASPNLVGAPPIADWTPGTRTIEDIPADEGPFRVFTTETTRTSEPFTIHVGASYEDVAESTAALAGAMAVAVPGLSVLLAVLMWWLVGRTLRPVETIRAQVEAIGGGELTARVPVPASGDEISRLASTMNEMLQRLEQSAIRQRRFVSDASHELRSPLTRIRTLLEVDRHHPDTADLAASHAAVLEEALHMQQLVDDLLHLARSDAGRSPAATEPVDLAEIVRSEVERLPGRQGASLDLSEVEPAVILGHRQQLSRLVRNLIDNAVRHASRHVAVRLGVRDGVAELSVTDDGPGIPPDRYGVIFERFTRLDDARSTARGGSGLGLAIARDIATAHGGTIAVDAAHRGGARLVVRIPAHK